MSATARIGFVVGDIYPPPGSIKDYEIRVGDKLVLFEMHPHLGPAQLNRRTLAWLAKQSAPFLHAVTCWVKQGQRVENGIALWDEPPDPLQGFVRLGTSKHLVRAGSPLLKRFAHATPKDNAKIEHHLRGRGMMQMPRFPK